MLWETGRTVLLLVVLAMNVRSQVEFEVASIRPSAPGLTAREARHQIHENRFDAKAMTVGDFLDMLNGYQLFRVVGGPDWMRTDRYDVEAKADRPLDLAGMQQAVIALLAERFHLESHKEKREVPGIVLRAPKMPGGLKQAGSEERYSVSYDRQDSIFTAVQMSTLTNRLSQMWGMPVVDETGLQGAFDFKLALSQVEQRPQMIWGDRVREAVEALGLRVENRKIPLEITVVGRCERPSTN